MFCDIKNINILSDPTFEVKVEQMNNVINNSTLSDPTFEVKEHTIYINLLH